LIANKPKKYIQAVLVKASASKQMNYLSGYKHYPSSKFLMICGKKGSRDYYEARVLAEKLEGIADSYFLEADPDSYFDTLLTFIENHRKEKEFTAIIESNFLCVNADSNCEGGIAGLRDAMGMLGLTGLVFYHDNDGNLCTLPPCGFSLGEPQIDILRAMRAVLLKRKIQPRKLNQFWVDYRELFKELSKGNYSSFKYKLQPTGKVKENSDRNRMNRWLTHHLKGLLSSGIVEKGISPKDARNGRLKLV